MDTRESHRIVEVMLALAAAKGFAGLKTADIARRAKVKEDVLEAMFPTRFDLLKALGDYVDDKTCAAIGVDDFTEDETPRDRLFAVLMERFDILQAQRDGVVAVLKDVGKDPKNAAKSLPYLGRSMERMFGASGLIPCPLKVMGLSAVYLCAVQTWVRDESPDMTKTMATLDKHLRQAEKVVGFFAR